MSDTLSTPDTPSTPDSPPPPEQRPRPHAPLAKRLTGRNGSRLFVTLMAAWTIFVSFAAQMTPWIQVSLFTQPGDTGPWWRASLVQAVLIGLPLLFLAGRWRVERYRAIFQSWAWATGYLLLLTPTRVLPSVESQSIIALQVVLTLLYWVVVRTRPRARMATPRAAVALALVVGGMSALPWLRWGAFGAPLDLILNGALAASFALLVWTILHVAWIPAMRRDPRHPRRDRATGGLVVGVTLLIMASALSLNGVQLLLMIVLPALAWAMVAAGASALTTALVLAAPLLLVDSDGLVIAAMDWLLAYYFSAAALSMAIGWILALVSLLPAPDPARALARPAAWAAAVVVVLLAGVVYISAAQTGFFGDRLFVVMRDQADVSAAAALPDLTARRMMVYRTLVEHADATQADLRAALDRLRVGYRPYYLTNGLEVRGGLLVRWWLARRDDVAEVMVSPHLRPVEPLDLGVEQAEDAPTEAQWNLISIGAVRVWHELGVTGEGIVIGQSDSGVQVDHPEFAARYRGATTGNDYNWLDPWQGAPAPYDEAGHGTHTLGTVLGDTVGVAPGATWFACANLIRNLGNPAFYLDCMQFMLAPYPQQGDPLHDGDPARAADVLNNSWGCPPDVEGCATDVFAPALRALRAAGIYMVVSAGNDGPLCSSVNSPPAIYAQVLSVGALDENGDLASFSSTGPVTLDGSGRIKPDLLAPGVDVLSAWPGSAYHTTSGTSMAGPHVAGTVALMWAANPALRGDVARTTEILRQTARPFHGKLGPSVFDAMRDAFVDPAGADPASNDLVAAAQDFAEALQASEHSCWAQTDLSVIPNNVAGYGVVDVYAAVQAALAQQ